MAHTGKTYELHLRRDLGLQCTDNKQSWPKRGFVGFNNCIGTVGAAAFGVLLPCNVDFELPSGRMFARTEDILIGGTLCYAEVDLTIRGFPQLYAGHVAIFRSTGVKLYESKCSNNLGRYISFSGQEFDDQVFETPGVFEWNRAPANGASFFRARTWHEVE